MHYGAYVGLVDAHSEGVGGHYNADAALHPVVLSLFLDLEVKSGAESSYTLYDDDRTSRMSLSDGAYRLINFTGKRDGRNIYITIKTTGKEYADRWRTRRR